VTSFTRAVTGLALLAAGFPGCHRGAPENTTAHAKIGGEVVARVGDVDLPASLVRDVATARGTAPAAALALLIDDVVAAKYAAAHGLDRTAAVNVAVTSVRGRATIDHVKAAARQEPPTDDEVRALTELHWVEVDAPETIVAVHAIALRPKKADPRLEAAAKAVAANIATAVASAVDAADFEAKANAVPHPEVEVVVQPLEPFAADGRVAVAGSQDRIDTQFAAAAAALPAPGATTGVVESSFGWHVIRLIEKRPPRVIAFEERRRMFSQEVYLRRTHDSLDFLERTMMEREPVTRANGLEEILAEALPAARAQDSPAASPVAP